MENKITLREWLTAQTWVDGPGYNPHPHSDCIQPLFTGVYGRLNSHNCHIKGCTPTHTIRQQHLDYYYDCLLKRQW